MSRVSLIVFVFALTAGVALAQGPADVILEGTCTTGWVGCPADDGVLQPDGSYSCLAEDIGIIGFTGDELIGLVANDRHGNAMFACQNRLDLGQINPTGQDGMGGDWVALSFDAARNIFPSAFQGNGSAVVNDRTLPGVGSCTVFGEVTQNYQSVITRNGLINLRCFLPDPPQGD